MSLFKAASTVSLLTLASRVTGLVRDLLMASMFGANVLTDAFNVAFRIPNLFRRLFAEGAFNSAFVPMFAGRLEASGPAIARGFAERVLATMLAFLLLLTILAELAMPWLIMLFAPGFIDDPGKFGMTVLFTAITLAIGVGTWMFSALKFQADMGILLSFMFLANMVGAIVLMPALLRWLTRPKLRAADQ